MQHTHDFTKSQCLYFSVRLPAEPELARMPDSLSQFLMKRNEIS